MSPELGHFSRAALALLGRDGATSCDGMWRLRTTSPGGTAFDISCAGPELPAAIPNELAHPSVIPFERPWVGVLRLTVKAPLVVFDIAWRPGGKLRIMNFSRGNWEDELLGMAR